MTKEERLAKAAEFRKAGYNCASSVLLAFPDLTGLEPEQAIGLTNALGSGIAGTGEMCGAVAAMTMARGCCAPREAAAKGEASTSARRLIDKFAAANGGCLRCADLKRKQAGGCVKSCNELVAECVALLHDDLNTPAEAQ